MAVQTFAAATMQAAFARVRDKLGAQAVIVDVRRSPGRVEVIAGRERPRSGTRRFLERGARTARVEISEELEVEAEALPQLRLLAGPGERSSTIGRVLTGLDFPPDLAAKIASIAGKGDHVWARLLHWLEISHPTVQPTAPEDGSAVIIGLLGGRQTGRSMLARGLAARAALAEPGRVLWIQCGFPARRVIPMSDLFAPLGVDHRTANHPDELAAIADEHGDVSASLVDLPGVDLASAAERTALARYVSAARALWPQISWHGVVPATWSARGATRSLRHCKSLGAEAAAWTHLDRVADPGTVLASTLRSGLAPSFLHGDDEGEGETSRAAAWDELIGWLRGSVQPEQEQER